MDKYAKVAADIYFSLEDFQVDLDELKLKVDHNTDYSQIFRDFLLDKYKTDVKLVKKLLDFDNKTKEI